MADDLAQRADRLLALWSSAGDAPCRARLGLRLRHGRRQPAAGRLRARHRRLPRGRRTALAASPEVVAFFDALQQGGAHGAAAGARCWRTCSRSGSPEAVSDWLLRRWSAPCARSPSCTAPRRQGLIMAGHFSSLLAADWQRRAERVSRDGAHRLPRQRQDDAAQPAAARCPTCTAPRSSSTSSAPSASTTT